MWINLTKKPMKPMIANPSAVAMAIFWNSIETRSTQSIIKEHVRVTQLTFQIWFCTALDQSHWVLGEVLHRFYVLMNNVHLALLPALTNSVGRGRSLYTTTPIQNGHHEQTRKTSPALEPVTVCPRISIRIHHTHWWLPPGVFVWRWFVRHSFCT